LLKTYVFDDESKRMVEHEIEYVPGLYKIYDEILVNAIDQTARLKADIKAGKKDVKPVKTIRINIHKDTGYIEVLKRWRWN